MKNGKIGVTTENIFPVIKKFLYSDHEIFLRELISNAVDATQKLKTLSSIGEMKGELGDLTIHVAVDKEAKTLTVTDRGVGMTAEEVDKYINQIAFSGAEEFMEKYKNQSIIGHFGLGFYSSFMVADKVEIFTKSYKKEAKTVHWSCTGTPEFEMEETDAEHDRGTTIVLHLSEDSLEYAESSKVEELLRKYCRFLPVPIAFGKVKEWKDGKYVDTDKDNIINNVDPLWTRKPADITEEQYKELVIAYEPVWAIGTGKTATAEQAQEIHAYIRKVLAEKFGAAAEETAILYGGSCKPSNAAEIFAKEDVDGGLIGGAALKAEDFLGIGKGFSK